ncbi:fructose-bisphosphatase class II family protein [Dichotomicrobium thermohalophilum]|uniref:Fructose-1,6-bisphosphatase n=1 Tax=Dichotomicrobium thermohalophilum TaxID=933063 RepID=A0A397PEK9_9HYPH|nr:fructose-bisphosphatase class II family protein [Dichotomicrobium thermohalophilum]RIA47442.1 fructose-1,6-bisphosphatase II / sedoheptulose-1,7-bisphosphatase [Dichotomicrobium thermohalophilum]
MTDSEYMLPDGLLLSALQMTEATAIAAAAHRGRGDEPAAMAAAAQMLLAELDRLEADGRIMVGDSEMEDERLMVGTRVGTGGPRIDLAVSPLEGATLCAKALPNALSAVVMGLPDSLLSVPDVYMEKIAIGPGYPEGLVDLDMSPADNLQALAEAKGVQPKDITVCVLDRPRHGNLIAALRETGAAVRLISDGDIAAVIETARADLTGLDIYMGMGGAPEGLIAAAALRCMGGRMQARLTPLNNDQRQLVAASGLDPQRKYRADELAAGDIVFSATGISGGALLRGILSDANGIHTHTLAMRSARGSVRWVSSQHKHLPVA